MLIVRHLGTPNSSFLLASLEAYVCAIQYYSDQWVYSACQNENGRKAVTRAFIGGGGGIFTYFCSGADLGFFTHQSNAEGVSHARGVRGHAPP